MATRYELLNGLNLTWNKYSIYKYIIKITIHMCFTIHNCIFFVIARSQIFKKKAPPPPAQKIFFFACSDIFRNIFVSTRYTDTVCMFSEILSGEIFLYPRVIQIQYVCFRRYFPVKYFSVQQRYIFLVIYIFGAVIYFADIYFDCGLSLWLYTKKCRLSTNIGQSDLE